MKNFKRIFAIVLALACALMLFSGCQKAEPETAPKIFAISGPTGVGMVHLMEDYDITLSSAPEEVVGKVANNEADIAAVPTNVASTLYKKLGGELKVLCVNTLGVLYIMDKDGSIKSFADLEGKTIYTMGEGSNPQYTLEYLLEKIVFVQQ